MEAGTPPSQVKSPQEAAASSDPAERLDGLHAWITELDRKLQTRFLALAAATVLALAASIVAVILALGLQDDSATKGELSKLRDQVDQASRSASDAAEESVSGVEDRLAEIESQIEAIRSDQSGTGQELSVLQDDIADLRDQIAAVEQAQEDAAASSADENQGSGNNE